jgi:hypothetical protein
MALRTSVVALLVVMQLLASGCVLTTAALVAPRTTVEIVDAKHRVEVRSVPEGARVRGASQRTITTPGDVEVPYRIERKGRTYRLWAVVAAGLVSLGAASYLFNEFSKRPGSEFSDIAPWRREGFPLYVVASDAFAAAFILPTLGARNENWRALAKERPLPVTRELTVEWDGWAPVHAQVVTPTQSYLTIRRPSLGTFDEAVIRWDRTSGLTPAPDGMLELAGAYDRLVDQTGRAEHAERAVHFYDQYRTSGEAAPDKAERARTRAEALRARYHLR